MNTERSNARLACTAFLLVGGALGAVRVDAAQATGNATATVITPIAIANTRDLAFGRFSPNSTGGTIVMTPGGVRTATGQVVLSATNSTQTAANFNVTGDGVSTYAITLPADGAVTISDGGSGSTHVMHVDTFTSNPSGTGVLASGAQSVTVGATLTVNGGQTPNNYTGTFNVVVEYN